MWRQVLKIIWKQRKANGWILAELILVSILTWYITDYFFMEYYNRSIPDGFDLENVYLVKYMQLEEGADGYREEEADADRQLANWHRFIRRIRQYPGVEGVAVTYYDYPYAGSYYGRIMVWGNDTAGVETRRFYTESDYFKVFRFLPVSGEAPETFDRKKWQKDEVIITSLSEKLHGGEKSRTQNRPAVIYMMGKDSFRVAGIVKPVKRFSYEQPTEIVFTPVHSLDMGGENLEISFRVKEGTAEKPFMEEFHRTMAKQLIIGNMRFIKLVPYHRLKADTEYTFGVTNEKRIMSALLIFFAGCTVLGMYGTFWLKNESRRSESGLRMAMGSSGKQLGLLYLSESWLLVTLACIVGFFIVGNLVYGDIIISGHVGKTKLYWMNDIRLRFVTVSFLTWLLMLLVATLSVWIPARASSKLKPAEVLHEE